MMQWVPVLFVVLNTLLFRSTQWTVPITHTHTHNEHVKFSVGYVIILPFPLWLGGQSNTLEMEPFYGTL